MSWKDEVKKNQPDDYDEYQGEMERNRAFAWLQTDVDDIINDLETFRDNLQDARQKYDETGDFKEMEQMLVLSKAIGELRADLQDWI